MLIKPNDSLTGNDFGESGISIQKKYIPEELGTLFNEHARRILRQMSYRNIPPESRTTLTAAGILHNGLVLYVSDDRHAAAVFAAEDVRYDNKRFYLTLDIVVNRRI
ncbi:hypothetical protein HYV82_03700 [Candidatus Woesearchaeota archaeon]|nr:hypothetical protein [Candidatus Woesearchaeota archaeon]